MEQRFRALDDSLVDKPAHQKPKIQRVPITLGNASEGCYQPRVISVGPIHHGNPKYGLAAKFKLKLAALFIEHCGQTKEFLFYKIKGEIKELRECFDEELIKDYEDEDLAWLLLVDGCAVLHHLHCMENGCAQYKKLKVKTDRIVFVQGDLFLLENQIPFQVFKLLIESSINRTEWEQIIENFISRNTMERVKQRGQQRQQQGIFEEENPTHLLDLLRTRLIGSHKSPVNKTKNLQHVYEQGQIIDECHTFRNIKELTELGIQAKPSETSHLRDISFRSKLFAYLHLPPILVDDSTRSKFLNLIAYEMCPDFQNDFAVTSYVCFLDTLIDHPQDVKELRSAHILYNLLGSDEQVAKLFNCIATGLVHNPDIYKDVKTQIDNHCSSTGKTWFAQTYYIYFSTPWAITGFLAALFALFLTSVQTWFAVFPKNDS